MKTILRAYYSKPLVIYLVTSLLSLTMFSGPAEAMFVPAAPQQGFTGSTAESAGRAAELAKIQAALESKVVQQKLKDYGLTPEEAMARINKLSDDQIHQFATNTEAVQAGGDGVEALIGLVILAILVVVLIYLLQHRIEIK
ncbi:MAG TPA: PA2779 family protein [Nitrospirota bacterium]|nr:PA2779 family protein [Nitrospirota bacterium]